jgi:hypothetical protein
LQQRASLMQHFLFARLSRIVCLPILTRKITRKFDPELILAVSLWNWEPRDGAQLFIRKV